MVVAEEPANKNSKAIKISRVKVLVVVVVEAASRNTEIEVAIKVEEELATVAAKKLKNIKTSTTSMPTRLRHSNQILQS